MKNRPHKLIAPLSQCLVATAIALAASSANGQSYEHVVGGEVLSDTVAEPSSGGCYVGDLPIHEGGAGGGTVIGRGYGRPDLFYNFFTQGYANGVNAQMYLSPLPIPPNVGHTFYTYQPFYPHHMMYWHKDRFHRYYDNGRGMNRTRAVYFSPPLRQAASNFYWNKLRLPR